MEKLHSSLRVSDDGLIMGPRTEATCRALWVWQKMRSACLRLRAKGIRCSCRTPFAVEGDILAWIVPSRASSMAPTSFIPHGKRLLCKDYSLWDGEWGWDFSGMVARQVVRLIPVPVEHLYRQSRGS